jgi:serine/threonine-protein kinase
MDTPVKISFLAALRKSNLLSEDELTTAIGVVGEKEPQLSRHLVAKGLLTKFQASRLRTGVTGFFVDKYIVVDFIGKGGNSVVYKARHRYLPNRIVALKTVLTGNVHQDAEVESRFKQEVDIVSQLDHPNVVRAYDVVLRRNDIFLVLEYVEGCDLAQLVSQFGPLPVADAADYAVQAARALAYAHRLNIVHRDIKPANLLLARDGVLKVADLGLAQVLSRRSGAEEDGALTCIGTPEFMSPEQVESSDYVDTRSDLYSLGATLFHLLTAELPVKGNTYMHKLKHLLTMPPRPLAEARPDVPVGLAELVDRLRARRPEQRPNSAEDVIAALTPFARKHTQESDARNWDGRRKAALILDVLKGKVDVTQACAPYGLAVEEFEAWKHRFLEGGAEALDGTGSANAAQETIRALYAKIGAQAMELEMLKSRPQPTVSN